MLRLEANTDSLQAHLGWLDPENNTQENFVEHYEDLYRDAADGLQQAGLYSEALKFYQALLKAGHDQDATLRLEIGKCYLRTGQDREAEESFQTTIHLDRDNIDARVELARMYEDLDDQEQAFIYVNDLIRLRREQSNRKRQNEEEEDPVVDDDAFMPAVARRTRSYYQTKRLMNKEERRRKEAETAERLLEKYSVMRLERNGMREHDPRATKAWMEAALEMIEDFRGFKQFYSTEKYVRFLGYNGAGREQPLTGATPLDNDLAEMAKRISSRKSERCIDGTLLTPL